MTCEVLLWPMPTACVDVHECCDRVSDTWAPFSGQFVGVCPRARIGVQWACVGANVRPSKRLHAQLRSEHGYSAVGNRLHILNLPTVTCDPRNAVCMCRARRGSNSQDSLEQTLVRGPLLVPRTRLHDTGAAKQRQDWPWLLAARS
jgi:hypothetical protein